MRVKKKSHSEGSVPWVWGLFAGNALASGSASRGEGGEQGRRRRGGIPEIISLGGMHGCSPETANVPLRVDLDLLGESGGGVLERVLGLHRRIMSDLKIRSWTPTEGMEPT